MKWIILLFLLFLIIAFITTRYRKQINSLILLLKMIEDKNLPETKAEKQILENPKEVPLVKCADCGTWTPQSNALNFRSEIYFCSTNCKEKAEKVR